MPDLPFYTRRMLQHVECYFDCCGGVVPCLFSTNWAFLRDRFIDRPPATSSTDPRGLGPEWKTRSLCSYSIISLLWPVCQWRWLHIYQQIRSYLCNASTDGTSERYNWVNELHALICCSFIQAARGVTTIRLLHRLLYVWWVPRRENLIMQSNFLKACCFDVWSKEEVYPLHSCFLLFFNEYLNNIVIYLFLLSVELHRGIFRFMSAHLHSQGWGEVYRLVHRRCHAWLCDSARRHAWESIFLLLFEGFGDIFWFFPSGVGRVKASLVSSTSWYSLQGFCLKGRGEKEGSFTS